MNRVAIAVVLAGLLAGCAAPGPVTTTPPVPSERYETPPSAVVAGAWAFHHPGGRLDIKAAPASVLHGALYDRNDVRVGAVGVGNASLEQAFDDLAAGELVLVLDEAVPGWNLTNADGAVDGLRPLRIVTERRVAAEGRTLVPMLDAATASFTAPVVTRTPPLQMRLFIAGAASSVEVKVRGAGGLVMEAAGDSVGFVAVPFQTQTWQPMQGTFHASNAQDGNLTAHTELASLDGAIVVEVDRYQRAAPVQDAPLAKPNVRFRYGTLPASPVRFAVAPAASQLSFEAGDEDARVALFDPSDRRIATLDVEARETVAYPVSSGDYVAIRLFGSIVLGADAAPSPFDLYPLEVVTTLAPTSSASDDGRYRQASASVAVDGILFDIEHVGSTAPGFYGCGDATFTVLQGDDVVARFGLAEGDAGQRYLRTEPVTLVYDDSGDGLCARDGLAFFGYLRP